MKGKAPNSPRIGFQVRLVKKPKPNWRNDSCEFTAIAMTIAITSKSKRSALKKRTARKIVSPVLPVGESARRLLHARKRAPKPEAGEGSVVCGPVIGVM